MANGVETVSFPGALVDDIWVACRKAVTALRYETLGFDGRTLAFKTRRSMSTWNGQIVEATVTHADGGPALELSASMAPSRLGSQVTDWGEGDRVVRRFAAKVAELIPVPASAGSNAVASTATKATLGATQDRVTAGLFECSVILGQMYAIQFSNGRLDDWEPFQNQVRMMGPLPPSVTARQDLSLDGLMSAILTAVTEAIPGINLDVPRGSGFKYTDPNDHRNGTPYFAVEVTYSPEAFSVWIDGTRP